LGCFLGWDFVSRVCFLGAAYELGALYSLYLLRPFRFFDIQHYLSKKELKFIIFFFFFFLICLMVAYNCSRSANFIEFLDMYSTFS
jgi:hypothetical protein